MLKDAQSAVRKVDQRVFQLVVMLAWLKVDRKVEQLALLWVAMMAVSMAQSMVEYLALK